MCLQTFSKKATRNNLIGDEITSKPGSGHETWMDNLYRPWASFIQTWPAWRTMRLCAVWFLCWSTGSSHPLCWLVAVEIAGQVLARLWVSVLLPRSLVDQPASSEIVPYPWAPQPSAKCWTRLLWLGISRVWQPVFTQHSEWEVAEGNQWADLICLFLLISQP